MSDDTKGDAHEHLRPAVQSRDMSALGYHEHPGEHDERARPHVGHKRALVPESLPEEFSARLRHFFDRRPDDHHCEEATRCVACREHKPVPQAKHHHLPSLATVHRPPRLPVFGVGTVRHHQLHHHRHERCESHARQSHNVQEEGTLEPPEKLGGTPVRQRQAHPRKVPHDRPPPHPVPYHIVMPTARTARVDVEARYHEQAKGGHAE
mmetsp:Transcript_12272/g.28098  ORF Transcript_12272/g.28098 Transcript_12272/m.28098 type:complete len:208 (+) Transcript_12272:273-896(+)